MDTIDLVKVWIIKYRNGTISQAEYDALNAWIQSHPAKEKLISRLVGDEMLEDVLDWIRLSEADQGDWLRDLERTTLAKVRKDRPFRQIWRSKSVIAASIALVLLAGATIFWINATQPRGLDLASKADNYQVPPARNQAKIITEKGVEFELDQTKSALVFGSQITYDDGSAVFQGDLDSDSLSWITLEVPKGGKYTIRLSDGSEVYLNSASKLRYPLRFSDSIRKIELDGEAYFKVQPAYTHVNHPKGEQSKKIPFHIVVNRQLIEVLGTELNVKAYSDDGITHTTLVTGSVKVSDKRQSVRLEPGEKVESTRSTFIKTKADISAETAWKNNKFIFHETELSSALKDISRWYNLELSYEGAIPSTHFYGEIDRDKELSQVLNMLEKIGLRFNLERIDGVNRLIIYP